MHLHQQKPVRCKPLLLIDKVCNFWNNRTTVKLENWSTKYIFYLIVYIRFSFEWKGQLGRCRQFGQQYSSHNSRRGGKFYQWWFNLCASLQTSYQSEASGHGGHNNGERTCQCCIHRTRGYVNDDFFIYLNLKNA